MVEKTETSLFLIKDAGSNKIVNLIIDHACLKNDYEIKKYQKHWTEIISSDIQVKYIQSH